MVLLQHTCWNDRPCSPVARIRKLPLSFAHLLFHQATAMHRTSSLRTAVLGAIWLLAVCMCRAQGFTHHHAVIPPTSAEFATGKLGWSIAVAGSHIMAGAPLALPGGGAVAWPISEFLSGPQPAFTTIIDGDERSSASIAAHEDVLAMSTCSALDDGYCAADPSSVFLYGYDGGWSALPTIQRPPWVHGAFGHALALHGDHLAIGAERSNEPGAEMPVVYLYERASGIWPTWPTDSLVGDGDVSDRFGALAMDWSICSWEPTATMNWVRMPGPPTYSDMYLESRRMNPVAQTPGLGRRCGGCVRPSRCAR